jgi:hypothetical protein
MKTIQEEYKEWAVGLVASAKGLVERHANAERRQQVKDKVVAAWLATKETSVTLVEKYANRDVRRKVGKGIVKAVMVALIFERDLIDNKILPRLNALLEEKEEPVVADEPVANVAVAPVEVQEPVLLIETVEEEPKVEEAKPKVRVLAENEGLKPAVIRERKPKAKKGTKPLSE